MKVLLKRAAALLFSVVIILSIMPGSVSAQEMATVFELPKMSTGIMSSEVVSLREERVKHYDMGNGIFQAVAYSHPVHEKDSSGNWVDIDFGLKLSETKNERMYCNATAGTAFAEKYVPNQTVMELYSKGDSISMSLINASESVKTGRNASDAVVAEITNSNNSFKTFEEAKSAKFSSRVLYRDVLTGVDLEYIVDPGMVKENIIVKEKANDYQYKFSLNLI